MGRPLSSGIVNFRLWSGADVQTLVFSYVECPELAVLRRLPNEKRT
jgi:hypothetical protein